MKPILYLRTRDSQGDLCADRIYACEHPRKVETDLRQDYVMSFDMATTSDPEEWTMTEVFENMQLLGWNVKELELVTVQY